MAKKSWVLLIIFSVLILQHSNIQAQKIEKKYQLAWTEPFSSEFTDGSSKEFLHFEQAVYTQRNKSLPCICESFPVDNFYSEYDVKISDIEWMPLSAKENDLIPTKFTYAEIQIEVVSAYERNHPFALLTIVPFVRNSHGQIQKVKSITLSFEGKKPQIRHTPKREHASTSVLATGNWYRFSLKETGIYKVTGADLASCGLNIPTSTASLALFGNGGCMLPEPNSQWRPDDLLELPIQVFDGGDGQFDNNDYFLFYGHSPHTVEYNTSENRFQHTTNIYTDSTWYFITNTPGLGEKKRVQTVNNNNLSANISANDYIHFDFIEKDSYNFSETGKDWFGDHFDISTTLTYRFQVPGVMNSPGKISISAANVSSSNADISISANNNTVGRLILPRSSSGEQAHLASNTFSFTPTSEHLSIDLTYSKPTTSSSAYLNWISIEVPCMLKMHSPQFAFSKPSTAGTGNITQFNISNANSSTVVWDVTTPSQTIQYQLSSNGNQYSFKVETDTVRNFYAFDGSSFKSVRPEGTVANQNLHATGNVDMVIVTHPIFQSQAKRLAEARQAYDGLTVKVVTTEQVYNEFSGGSQDPMAIRDYMKHIYDRTNKQYPKYLLLFGRPSYDFRGRINGTEIFVPNYQYAAGGSAINESDFYSNDDTFGLLDDEEGGGGYGLYDLAIGRFPASTVAQANAIVDKSIRYTAQKELVEEHSSSISNFGDWRNMMAFVADDENYNDFITNADAFTKIIETANPNINFDKIYLDAYQQVSNAGGQRYPEANTAINQRMDRGCLFFTYIGHSGKDGWAAERILENSDINKWKNKYNLPVMLTLSCTFGYYDRPALSPAELAIFNSNGGVSAIITTTREAWSSPNNSFGRHIFNTMFDKSEGKYPTIGEIEYKAKNKYTGAQTSLAMFVTMGDPSMPLAIPRYKVITDSINHIPVAGELDTLRALSKVTISGHITDDSGNLIDNFNGSVFPSVYDKKVNVTSLANDPSSQPFDFQMQKSILFKGDCTVKNGRFTFSFYVPQDIDYNFGNGRISYYAKSAQLKTDGAGAFTEFIIGGTDPNGINDKEGPEISLFLNDENFVSGGIVDPNPVMIAKIKDKYGINTTGNGIGHNLTAIIDNATENPIVLNDYYQTEKDSFNMGTVRYNLEDLSPGKHTLLVRAWDINNNHSEREISFEVLSTEKLTLNHVLNYPNPFTTHTDFYFEQNQNGGMFDIQIQIFTISGKLVKTINTTQYIEGNRSAPIAWDGTDDYGDKIGKGVYMYRLRVRNQNNEISEKLEKIVIL